MTSDQDAEALMRHHHTRMTIVLKWFITFAFITISSLVTLGFAAQAMVAISNHLRGVDWGTMFSFSIFAIMMAAACSIILHGAGNYHRKQVG